MGKGRKRSPEERAKRLQREREFRELLERRLELDRRLAAERGERPQVKHAGPSAHSRTERLKREREFWELLERRVEVDRRLAAEQQES